VGQESAGKASNRGTIARGTMQQPCAVSLCWCSSLSGGTPTLPASDPDRLDRRLGSSSLLAAIFAPSVRLQWAPRSRYGEEMPAPNPILDAASQRPVTEIDTAARVLILRTLKGVSNTALRDGFFRNRYSNFDDYAAAVREVWGDGPTHEMRIAWAQAAKYQAIVVSAPTARQREEMTSEAMLLHMPEPDFRVAVSNVSSIVAHPDRTAKRISAICRTRGVPWEFTVSRGFRWVGDHSGHAPEVSRV
jgi:hypothetical protein